MSRATNWVLHGAASSARSSASVIGTAGSPALLLRRPAERHHRAVARPSGDLGLAGLSHGANDAQKSMGIRPRPPARRADRRLRRAFCDVDMRKRDHLQDPRAGGGSCRTVGFGYYKDPAHPRTFRCPIRPPPASSTPPPLGRTGLDPPTSSRPRLGTGAPTMPRGALGPGQEIPTWLVIDPRSAAAPW